MEEINSNSNPHVMELVELTRCIMEYYTFKGNSCDPLDTIMEDSVKGTEFSSPTIPENVDKSIEKSFLSQLKKFQ